MVSWVHLLKIVFCFVSGVAVHLAVIRTRVRFGSDFVGFTQRPLPLSQRVRSPVDCLLAVLERSDSSLPFSLTTLSRAGNVSYRSWHVSGELNGGGRHFPLGLFLMEMNIAWREEAGRDRYNFLGRCPRQPFASRFPSEEQKDAQVFSGQERHQENICRAATAETLSCNDEVKADMSAVPPCIDKYGHQHGNVIIRTDTRRKRAPRPYLPTAKSLWKMSMFADAPWLLPDCMPHTQKFWKDDNPQWQFKSTVDGRDILPRRNKHRAPVLSLCCHLFKYQDIPSPESCP